MRYMFQPRWEDVGHLPPVSESRAVGSGRAQPQKDAQPQTETRQNRRLPPLFPGKEGDEGTLKSHLGEGWSCLCS